MRSIRNLWFALDGIAPHCVLHFQGNRILIICFTRAKYLIVKDDVTMTFLHHGLNAIREEYGKYVGKQKQPPSFAGAAVAAAADGPKCRKLEAAPEDEIDEEKQMDAALVMKSEGPQWRGKDWVRQFRECLGISHSGHAFVGRSVSLKMSCMSMGPVLVL